MLQREIRNEYYAIGIERNLRRVPEWEREREEQGEVDK